MKFSEVQKAKNMGAIWCFRVRDEVTGDEFFEYAWSNDEKNDMKDEYNWTTSFTVLELKPIF